MTADVIPLRRRAEPDALNEAFGLASAGIDRLIAEIAAPTHLRALEIIATEAVRRVAVASSKTNAMGLADCASDIEPEGAA